VTGIVYSHVLPVPSGHRYMSFVFVPPSTLNQHNIPSSPSSLSPLPAPHAQSGRHSLSELPIPVKQSSTISTLGLPRYRCSSTTSRSPTSSKPDEPRLPVVPGVVLRVLCWRDGLGPTVVLDGPHHRNWLESPSINEQSKQFSRHQTSFIPFSRLGMVCETGNRSFEEAVMVSPGLGASMSSSFVVTRRQPPMEILWSTAMSPPRLSISTGLPARSESWCGHLSHSLPGLGLSGVVGDDFSSIRLEPFGRQLPRDDPDKVAQTINGKPGAATDAASTVSCQHSSTCLSTSRAIAFASSN
jgi:hypothetical protein